MQEVAVEQKVWLTGGHKCSIVFPVREGNIETVYRRAVVD